MARIRNHALWDPKAPRAHAVPLYQGGPQKFDPLNNISVRHATTSATKTPHSISHQSLLVNPHQFELIGEDLSENSQRV